MDLAECEIPGVLGRWVAVLLDRDRTLHLGDLRELADLLVGVGRHDQVAVLRLERWLRARGYEHEAAGGLT